MRRIALVAALALSACSATPAGDDPGALEGADDYGSADTASPEGEPDPSTEPEGEATNPAEDLLCTYGTVANPFSHDDMSESGPFDVATVDQTFTDPTRPTPPNGSYDGADSRTLKTTIYYPAAPRGTWNWFGNLGVAEGGPFPLVMYSHGFSSSNAEAKELGEHLASHGYIVVAPTFPLSHMLAPGGAAYGDVHNQPADISFLIDQMLARNAYSEDLFFRSIDAERIAAAGLSLGGMTTSLVSFHPRFGDERIQLAVTLAGPSSFFAESFYRFDPKPLLLIHGDIDAFIHYEQNALVTLERAQPNASLVTIHDGSHAGFSGQIPDILLPLVNSLMGPDGSDPNNPDSLGCGFVGNDLAEDASSDEGFMAYLGDESDGILMPDSFSPDDYPLPCSGDEITLPALSSADQVDITKRAALAFLDAYFALEEADRESACQYLYETLPEDEDTSVE